MGGASVYCRYGDEIGPYLEWMRKVVVGCEGKAMMIGMDANAVSPLWYSKYVRTGRESERRGRELKSDLFTFSGPMEELDIDLTVVNGGWLERFVCDTWEVKEDWGVSYHNCVLIGVEGVRAKIKAKIKKEDHGKRQLGDVQIGIGREAYMTSPESFARILGGEQLESYRQGDKKVC
ncbi:hypothetical protein Zmor_021503 [Zophobas morio]|uniref:Endonuclease/exonuclease/phosphatase domain-containing protein n=1 Tax=Zophobas morio TaxID=2755281 RepID=A0AA38I653_9CUCU|nr:hypothetical protein Zmor_021503 [Zophobas morio]